MTDAYIIQRYVWDIDYPYRDKAYALQTRFSRLFEAAAVPIMEAVFEECVPGHRLLRLETLELDLGVLPADYIERDFPERFKAALQVALRERLGLLPGRGDARGLLPGPGDGPGPLPGRGDGPGLLPGRGDGPGLLPGRGDGPTAHRPTRQGAPPESMSPTLHTAELLEYFLLEGSLPWWAARSAEEEPQRLLERLHDEAPGHLAPLLLRAGQLAYVRRRLAYQFPDTGLRAAVGLIAPGEGAFISAYHAAVVRAQQETRWVPRETTSFSQELWLFILTFLLKDMAGYFNRRAFVRQTLMDMARHYNVSYPGLLALLSEALRRTASRFQDQDSLQKIIRELDDQWEGNRADPTPDIFQEDVLDLEEKLASLRHYLLGHVLPEGFNLPLLLSTLSTRLPSTLRRTLSDLGRAEAVRERVAETFGDFGLQLVVRLEEPTHADVIFDYAAHIQAARRFQTDTGSFRSVVWTIILGYLWSQRGSVFNTRMFLERQILGLGQHYRMDYGELLSLLVGEQAPDLHGPASTWAALEPSSLFRLLLDIWKEYVRSGGAQAAQRVADAQPSRDAQAAQRAPDAQPSRDARQEPDAPPAPDAQRTHGSASSGGAPPAGSPGEPPPGLAEGLSEAGADADTALFLPPNPDEAAGLYQALLRLLRELVAPDIASPEGATMMAAWERALPILREIGQGVSARLTPGPGGQGLLPSWWEAGRAFDAARFLEEGLRWLSARTGLETAALTRGLALAAQQDTTVVESASARALKYLLLAATPGLEGAGSQGLPPGVTRLITSWLSSPKGRETAQVQTDPRLETALQTWMEKRQPGWDKRTLAFMKDLRRLFLSVLHTTPERDDFEALFLDCSILFLGDRYGAKDPQTFALTLLTYMEGRRKTSPALYLALLKAAGPPHRYSVDGTPFFPAFRALLRRRLPEGADATPIAATPIAASQIAANQTAANQTAPPGANEQALITPGIIVATGAAAQDAAMGGPTQETAAAAQDAAMGGPTQGTAAAQRASAEATDRQRIALEIAEARRKEETQKRARKPSAGLYIHNAGLVLLHPLLPTLFNRLQWLEKGQFVGPEAQQRAVHLLQFIVFGLEGAGSKEQDLVLNKIICGLSPEDPIPLELTLTEGEMSLGEELLRVVLQQWPRLGNTSILGLQATFLQRGGSLKETPEAWNLRVEQRGVDVLLSFLPWAWGMIKPSWMQKTLHVEWT
jgi:hypothetical protein